jgi:hypothetical protein
MYISDNCYNKEQIVNMERDILQSLEFEVMWPSQLRFLERYAKISSTDEQTFHLAQFMLELAIVDVEMNRFRPSLLACGALYTSKKILSKPNSWSGFMSFQTKYSH